MNKLKDRVAIVTGASGGIGRSIAEAYAREGAQVILASRNTEALDEAVDHITGKGGHALAVQTDVTSEADVQNLFRVTIENFSRADILINNAGVTAGVPTDEMDLATWQRVIDVNVTGAFLCSREALRCMKRQKRGRIINIGSVSAKVPRPNAVAYVTSKFALEGLTRSVALDARPFGIAVSVLQLGNTATPILQGWEERARQEGVMAPEVVADVAVTMAALPDSINFLEGIVLPVSMPLIGRG